MLLTGRQLAWLIAFIASIIANLQVIFPNLVWWTIAYTLCCIVGLIVVMGTDTGLVYGGAVCHSWSTRIGSNCTNRRQVVGYLSYGLVLSTLAVNSLVTQPQAAKQAGGAGFILLSMVIVGVKSTPTWISFALR